MRRRRWLAPALVLGIAAVLRFWALSRPDTLVFDELYYVRDAISQLAHGFPTTWPDDEPDMSGERATAFTGDASNAVHPPLGKWLIGLGIVAFGPGTGWGWRSAVALAGVATVAVVMRLGWLLSRSLVIACTAGLLLAIDGVHVVLTRVGLLDGFLTLFVALGALFVWRDCEAVSLRSEIRARSDASARESPAEAGSPTELGAGGNRADRNRADRNRADRNRADRNRADRNRADRNRSAWHGIIWRRPWLLAAGACFGAASAVKWSGLYPLAFFLVYVTVRDLLARLRAARACRASADEAWVADAGSGASLPPGAHAESGVSGLPGPPPAPKPRSRSLRAVAVAAVQALITAAIALPAAAATYLASWTGWILNAGGWARVPGTSWPVALASYHAEMLSWHGTLSAPHPYQSHPITWPLALIPTAMYEVRWTDGCPWVECVSGISPLPNPLVTWGGAAALLALAYLVARRLGRGRFTGHRSGSPAAGLDPVVAAGAFALTGYLSGWLPWVLTFSRSAVFQFYAVVLTPFSALALALLLGMLCGIPIRSHTGTSSGLALDASPEALRGRRIAVALFIAVALALAALFFPVWSGVPLADWFWKWHMWLPGWS